MLGLSLPWGVEGEGSMKKLLEHQKCYELRKFRGFWHRCQVSVEKAKVMMVDNFKNLNKLNGENKDFFDGATQRLTYTINISVKKNFFWLANIRNQNQLI